MNVLDERIWAGIKEQYKSNDWYLYQGGKLAFEKDQQKERIEFERLTETRFVADMWKQKQATLDPMILLWLEMAISLTLHIEWGDTSEIYFNHGANEIVCSANGKRLVI